MSKRHGQFPKRTSTPSLHSSLTLRREAPLPQGKAKKKTSISSTKRRVESPGSSHNEWIGTSRTVTSPSSGLAQQYPSERPQTAEAEVSTHFPVALCCTSANVLYLPPRLPFGTTPLEPCIAPLPICQAAAPLATVQAESAHVQASFQEHLPRAGPVLFLWSLLLMSCVQQQAYHAYQRLPQDQIQ